MRVNAAVSVTEVDADCSGGGGRMAKVTIGIYLFLVVLFCAAVVPASAQSFRVQCPTSTITHPDPNSNNSESSYTGPTTFALNSSGYQSPTAHVNGAIKCQQISGGDGYATMADGTQTFMFSFGPLSGIANIAAGLPTTANPTTFDTPYSGPALPPRNPATAADAGGSLD